MKGQRILSIVLALGLILTLVAGLSVAQEPVPEASTPAELSEQLGAAFTYQGRLTDDSQLVNGTCDFRFKIFDAAEGDSQLTSSQTVSGVQVADGLFTVQVDFGEGILTGDARWLEIRVRCPAGADSYVRLSPRQPLLPAPYALAMAGLWTQQNATSPNLIGGWSGNEVAEGVVGATIGGGGAAAGCTDDSSPCLNRVIADYGTVSGGAENTATGPAATVGGGRGNTAQSWYGTVGGGIGNSANTGRTFSATVAGGAWNKASGGASSIGGGERNRASGDSASVGGGNYNAASGDFATIAGGAPTDLDDPEATNNRVTDDYGAIGGGGDNQAGDGDGDTTTAVSATVGGGAGNTASSLWATVGGGAANRAVARGCTVSGGERNTAMWWAATVGGGYNNTASEWFTTVAGGAENTATAHGATVGGGKANYVSGDFGTIAGGGPLDPDNAEATSSRVTDDYGTIGGGSNNRAGNNDQDKTNAPYATVAGGEDNTAGSNGSSVGGGRGNNASSVMGTVGGGYHNTASGQDATVAGGTVNVAGGHSATVGGGGENVASGWAATIPGGRANTAQGDYSLAVGRRAKAQNKGCFVWGDSTDDNVVCDVNNRWVARTSGGVVFYTSTDLTSSVKVDAGGNAWSCASDRDLKNNIEYLDYVDVVERLVSDVPVTAWSYKSEDPMVRHIGPMSQDFYAAFGLGADDDYISTVDADGVALAAIQGLYELSKEQAARIANLEARLAAMEALVGAMMDEETGGQQ